MTIGKLKLITKGKRDLILTVNPKLTFWKSVYKRHTNFAIQSFEIGLDNDIQISETKDMVFKYRIPRNGDLVNFISLIINLPSICSDEASLTEDGEFAWIQKIGASIIKRARLYYDDILIDEIDGDFLILYDQLNHTTDETKIFNKLIGHTPNVYNPYVDNVYKSCSPNQAEIIGTEHFLNKGFGAIPSIQSYELNIPILFSFFRNSDNLPLISNKRREVSIEIILRPINELYTLVSKTNTNTIFTSSVLIEDIILSSSGDYSPCDYSPPTTLDYKKRSKDDECRFYTKFAKNITSSFFNPRLEVSYVFLDNLERKEFVENKITQLIQIPQRLNFYNIVGHTLLPLDIYHPVKSIYMAFRRNDIKNRNQWSNYSNNDNVSENTNNILHLFSNGKLSENKLQELNNNWIYRDPNCIPILNCGNKQFYTENILEEFRFLLNSEYREDTRNEIFYRLVEKYETLEFPEKSNCYLYSFALNGDGYQPKGMCYMSSFRNIFLDITCKDPSQSEYHQCENYKYDALVYVIYYNEVVYMDGVGALKYGN